MDTCAQYCSTRRNLEEQGWFLASRLSTLTGQLLQLIGRDHAAFLSKKTECSDTREEIADSHDRLRAHRLAHGC